RGEGKGTSGAAEEVQRRALRAMPALAIIFIFSILSLQAFNLVFEQIGAEVGAPEKASLITAIPGIVLGIVAVIYGSLGDFVSLRKMMMVGMALIVVGSLMGLFLSGNIWTIIVARAIQTAGLQVSGSVYLVVATKYVPGPKKVIYFGVFTALYQLSTAIGVLAGGFLLEVNWVYLFAIALASVVFIPTLLKNLPDSSREGAHVDVPGFLLAGVTIAGLVLFFNTMNWWFIVAFVVLAVLFVLYINKARRPFVTPAFFANGQYLMAVMLIFLFYFGNFAMTPLFNSTAGTLYGMPARDMAFVLLWGYLAATIMGVSSGAIVGKIGRGPGILLAGGLLAGGAFLAAFTLEMGIVALGISAVVFFAGLGMAYAPVVDTVMGTVDVSESGRAVGVNDLMMNVSPSIGIALIGPWMAQTAFSGLGMPGVSDGAAASYSTLFSFVGVVAVVGLLWFFAVRPKVYADGWGRSTESGTLDEEEMEEAK
ncbi:MAG TPA: MFS transporter, partial [Actinomycetales bacterium]|nr:MFS transporter [Actinomycetales bacterium]